MLYDILPPLFLFASFAGIIIIVSRVVLRVRRQQFSEHVQSHGAVAAIPSNDVFKPEKQGVKLAKNRLSLIPQMIKNSGSNTKAYLQQRRERKQEKKTLRAAAKLQAQEPVKTSAEVAQSQEEQTPGGISMPTSSWRTKISSLGERSKQRVGLLKNRVNERFTHASEEEIAQESIETKEPVKPQLRLSTTDEAPKPAILRTVEPPVQRTVKTTRFTKKVVEEQPPVEVTAVPEESVETSRSRSLKNLFGKKEAGGKQDSALAQARNAIKESQYDKAEDILIPYIVQHSRDAKAYMLLGRAALGRAAYDEAVEIFQQVLKINPDQKGAHAGMGRAALSQGKMTLALQSLQRALNEDPTNLEVLKDLLTIAKRMDNRVLQASVQEQLADLKAKPKKTVKETA